MIDDPIPDNHHVARHYPKQKKKKDGKPMPAAFQLKIKKKEEYLSVDWLEFHNSNRANQIHAVRKIFKKRGYGVRSEDMFAVLNVGCTIKSVEKETSDNRKLSVTHQPRNKNDSHSGIFNTNHSTSELLVATIVSESVNEIHPAIGPVK